ncbi:hypothetical protein ColTof4_02139 [Colletotrichum tofieldiae]|nr:hypothetical protein ColTof3_09575 [Colletotrichum tofieldiae]GKT69716.1 hypothetical protein ColTof4_02139 [Colletotrichum tofieldiae]GKT92728.1 hypothetical protein Ct61P_10578 [Colletotrichum tofieldiae]
MKEAGIPENLATEIATSALKMAYKNAPAAEAAEAAGADKGSVSESGQEIQSEARGIIKIGTRKAWFVTSPICGTDTPRRATLKRGGIMKI